MSIVKFSRVISCSSEDQKYPAANLLESQVGKCWKCKAADEKQIVVILQLERSCRISSIDIGNENSAFIEIFVGRSASPDQYESLKITSLLMSAAEAKKGENKNAVRFFKEDEFSKPAADESWDRLKIICSQPFNKLTQYGLSFVKVRTKDLSNEVVSSVDPTPQKNSTSAPSPSQNTRLGKFKLKQDPKDAHEVPIGSLFSRRNDLKDEPASTAAAAIRAASTNSEPTLKRLSDLLPGFKDAKKARKNNTEVEPPKVDGRRSATGRILYEDTHSDDEAESNVPLRVPRNAVPSKKTQADELSSDAGTSARSDESPKLTRKVTRNKNENSTSKEKVNSDVSANTSNSHAKKSPAKKEVPNVRRKPFNRLLEGVVFVISGYQNPYRSELRNKALSMGATYRANWDSRCSHLICAFPNTPKASAVRGKGWILKKEWIEDCHSQRKRLSCTNYRMDKSDNSVYGRDEEIHEEVPDQTPTASRTNVGTPNAARTSAHEENEPTRKEDSDEENIYEAVTDVDSDHDDCESFEMEVLPDFFADKKIYLGADLSKEVSDKLERYITAFKGKSLADIDEAHYIISEDTRYKENVNNLPVLVPGWLWECTDQRRLVSIRDYSL